MLLPLLLGRGNWNGVAEGRAAATVSALALDASGYRLGDPNSSGIGAISFNAAGDALRQDSTSNPTSNSSYTLTMWVRPQSGTGDPSVWYDNDAAGTDLILGTNSGVVSAINGNGFTNIATVGSALSNNVWYFVALRVNGTTATVSRGDETNAVTHASGTCPAQGAVFRQWFGGTASAFFPTADICLVRMWNAVLSDAEVEAERTSATPARATNLFGDWPLASDSTKLTNNSSGGALTVPGSGTWSNVTGPTVGTPLREGVVWYDALANATLDASGSGGSVDVTGTVAATLANATSSAAGTVAPFGTVAVTLANATPTIVGQIYQTALDFTTLMPLISRPGKSVYGSGTSAQMFDGKYGYVDGTAEGAWSCTSGSWVAVNVGAGATQVLAAISNDNASGGSYLATVIEAYRLQVSNDSTNGSDGTWTTVVTVTGNTAYAREHKFSFTGYSWVKLLVDTCSGGQLDELNVWDASAGTPDTFAFLGDSITDGALRRHFYFGGGLLPSFQENVAENQPGHYPLQLNVGVTGQGASYWATNISSALSLYPDVKYWCINLGMNDGASMPSQLTQWRTDMTTVVNAIVSAGRVPIIARTTWTGATGYGGGDYNTCNLRYLNDNGVDYIVSNLSVRTGPDLFALFNANGTAYNVNSDPHPNETGYKAWTNAWADSLGVADPNYRYGNSSKTLSNATSSASGTADAPTVTGTVAQTLENATLSASGSTVTGTVAQTLSDATLAASGSHTISGTVAQTLANATSSAAGGVGASGSLTQTLGNASLSAAGGVGTSGTLAQTLANATLAAVGQFGNDVTGTLAQTLANATLAASGTALATGTLAQTLSAATLSASGTHSIAGTLAQTLDNASLSASGSTGTSPTGSVNVTLANATLNSSGAVGASGSLVLTLATSTLAASGNFTEGVSGSVNVTLSDSTLSASGARGASGTLAQTLGDATLSAAGHALVTGTASTTLAHATLSAVAGTGPVGSLALTLANATCSATGLNLGATYGDVNATLDNWTSTTQGVLASLPVASIQTGAASSVELLSFTTPAQVTIQ